MLYLTWRFSSKVSLSTRCVATTACEAWYDSPHRPSHLVNPLWVGQDEMPEGEEDMVGEERRLLEERARRPFMDRWKEWEAKVRGSGS